MRIANVDVREKIKESNVKYWMIANELGIADSTFSRWLRTELSDTQKEKITIIISKLSHLKKVGGDHGQT